MTCFILRTVTCLFKGCSVIVFRSVDSQEAVCVQCLNFPIKAVLQPFLIQLRVNASDDGTLRARCFLDFVHHLVL